MKSGHICKLDLGELGNGLGIDLKSGHRIIPNKWIHPLFNFVPVGEGYLYVVPTNRHPSSAIEFPIILILKVHSCMR